MKTFLIKNQLYIILGIIMLLCVTVFVTFFTVSEEEIITPSPSPFVDVNSLPIGNGQPAEGREYQYATPEEEQGVREDGLIGKFISELPYLGTYVRIDYSYADNLFMVRMDPDNIGPAEEEYTNLLKQKGISNDRLNLYNVKIIK